MPAYSAFAQYPGSYSISQMTISKNGGAPQQSDMPMAFNEAPVGSAANVSFTVL